MSQENSPHDSGAQWLRACLLQVAGVDGKGLELGEMRITFSITKTDTETPNKANITVYNLAEGTSNRIQQEFGRVVLSAGYKGNCTTIFDGTISKVQRGRENGTDTFTAITAADGDKAYNWAVVNSTLAAGSTPADRVKLCAQYFAEKGVNTGYLPEFDPTSLPRGKVFFASAKKVLRDEAVNTRCSWSVQDGALTMVPKTGYLPEEAVVLTHETGLVGAPTWTNEGLNVNCLLNPRLRVNGRIKLDNRSVQGAKTEVKEGAKTEVKESAKRPPTISADGLYRILKVTFVGDTRGNDWFAKLVCVALDGTSQVPLDVA
ncbi:phage protein [Desulfovibrio cuneatus]|uniref:phage protein n=1 Tax=Desulfovibrio cuneatus TaxID=159728 RepID=UPI000401321B|nr:hypothetical protein [Desulfovibrio cuneatus]